MRLSRKSIVAFSATLFVASISLAALFLWSSEIVVLDFDSYQLAVRQGAIEKEWLPGFLPCSAKNIHSITNLDSNTAIVTFNFDADFDKFIQAQQIAAPMNAKALGIRGHTEHFDDVRELTYMPKIVLEGQLYPGVLLVNRIHRKALYIK